MTLLKKMIEDSISPYWRGYRRGWYKGFIIGIAFALFLCIMTVVYWTGTQLYFK